MTSEAETFDRTTERQSVPTDHENLQSGAARRRMGLAPLAASSGPMLYALFNAVAFAIITRAGGVQDTADFLLAQAVATPAAFLCGLRLQEQFSTEPTPTRYLVRVKRLLLVSAAALVVLSIGWMALGSAHGRLVGISVLVANLAQIHVIAFQGRQARSAKFFAASQIDTVLGATSLAAIAGAYLLERPLWWGTTAMAICWSLIAAAAATTAVGDDRRSKTERPDPENTLGDDLGLGASNMLGIAQPNLGRIATDVVVGPTALARIATIGFFVHAGSILIAGARIALAPHLADAAVRGSSDALVTKIRRGVELALAVFLPSMALVGYFLAPPIIEAVFTSDVAPNPATGAVLLVGAGLLYASMIETSVLVSLERRRTIMLANAAAVLSTMAAIIPLGRSFGATGAALALGLGNALQFLVIHMDLGRRPVDGTQQITARQAEADHH